MVIRLTGDNVLPDGAFGQELTSALVESGAEYLCADSPQSRLPYGLAGEAFRSLYCEKLMRPRPAITTGNMSARGWREIVAPGTILRAASERSDYSHLRCTIDDEEDYHRICGCSMASDDPISAGWLELTRKLSTLPGEPEFRVPYRVIDNRVHSAMTLGTVQLGMEYGAVNRIGKPRRSAAIDIVRQAIAHGVTALDTGPLYGESEQILGEALSARGDRAPKSLPSWILWLQLHPMRARVEFGLRSNECGRLMPCAGSGPVGDIAAPSLGHHVAWGGAAWKYLVELRDHGKIGKLGVSISNHGKRLRRWKILIFSTYSFP